jgi:hypothetical protein
MPGKKKKRWDAWFVAALWICLMSGAASILREMLGLFVPSFSAPARIFQASAITCFVLSGWVAIYRKSARVRELEHRVPERYARMVDRAVNLHGDSTILVLRHLAVLGSIPFGAAHSPSLPTGMNAIETMQLLVALKLENLVCDDPIPVDVNSPLQMAMPHCVWRISPGIEPFLDEILCEYEG